DKDESTFQVFDVNDGRRIIDNRAKLLLSFSKLASTAGNNFTRALEFGLELSYLILILFDSDQWQLGAQSAGRELKLVHAAPNGSSKQNQAPYDREQGDTDSYPYNLD